MRYRWRWTVEQPFNMRAEGARHDGLGRLLDGLGNGSAGLGRTGDAAHSVQVRVARRSDDDWRAERATEYQQTPASPGYCAPG